MSSGLCWFWADFQNLRIMYQFPREYFEEQLTTVNGSYNVVKALKDGVVMINASLTSIIYQVGIKRMVFESWEHWLDLPDLLICKHIYGISHLYLSQNKLINSTLSSLYLYKFSVPISVNAYICICVHCVCVSFEGPLKTISYAHFLVSSGPHRSTFYSKNPKG